MRNNNNTIKKKLYMMKLFAKEVLILNTFNVDFKKQIK